MPVEILVGRVETPEELEAVLDLRRRVFVDEQGIPAELDADGADDAAVHLLAREGAEAVGTARLEPKRGGLGILGRVAVLPTRRGRGLGSRLVREAEAAAAEEGLRRIELHPHEHLEDFYTRLGYRRLEGTSVVAGYRLITMTRSLGTRV